MARFFPQLENTEFRSEGEFTLFQELAGLDDGFIVIHSLPWLRGKTKRLFSQELLKYIEVSSDRKHLTGEVDFVILHASLGMLCIETKSGRYRPSGVRFIHEREGYTIDPLGQVKDNTFTVIEMLDSWEMKCPVGYAVHLPDSDLDASQIASAFMPIGRPLQDGILILQKHRQDIPSRIVELMSHWKAALNYGAQRDFEREITRFLEAVWPREAQAGLLGRKIIANGKLWLRLDDRQAAQVTNCLGSNRRLIAGFSGSGKTLIARALAEEFALPDRKVLVLLKNRQITQKVSSQLSHLGRTVTVQTFHAYCESLGARNLATGSGEPDYDEHHRALHGKVDRQYAVLIVDEAQALNEADHLALRGHFVNARIFLFADELQVLPGIEKGCTYRFLEDTYGERFYYLASVYRNPGGITRTMIEMRPPRHEVHIPRPVADDDLSRTITWDVSKSLEVLRQKLVAEGAKTDDMVVLSQFPIAPGVIARSTISAYRGMEKPIVIVVAGFDMDDTTLACALGRATTRAYVLVPVGLLIGRGGVKSDFLRKGLEQTDISRFLDKDAGEPEPRFIDNLVCRFAGRIASHEVFGGHFSYATRWRRWLYQGAKWHNRGAQLWANWLELRTGIPVCGIDPVRNSLTEGDLQDCESCGGRTPHHLRRGCLACETAPLDDEEARSLAGLASHLDAIHTDKAQSVINVAALVGDSKFQRMEEWVGGGTVFFPELFLATSIIEFRMLRGAPAATKSQMEQWLRDMLVASELTDSIEGLTGRAIGSLCGQKLLMKTGPGQYQLTGPQ
ncbi:ATP-binding protein [Mitsuaria sp. 7]|uniref:ATP-binding protein n=1 Tax=Mitsuaria sp. 7 TaxID=1658665 RepID=UPI0007DD27A3|nr:ATP-binding protein [Mitsuaria sp. 7]ANH66602.1 hypothetical protein ABE85_01755 [Mitsuaria sp. 7]